MASELRSDLNDAEEWLRSMGPSWHANTVKAGIDALDRLGADKAELVAALAPFKAMADALPTRGVIPSTRIDVDIFAIDLFRVRTALAKHGGPR